MRSGQSWSLRRCGRCVLPDVKHNEPARYALRQAYIVLACCTMIVSYGDKRTHEFAEGRRVKAFSGIERAASNKLTQLDAATSIRDLMRPGNRFEALKGDRKGQYSIRINDQWRVCFEWSKGSTGPANVAIVDYH
jgi:proteic killer suppression protein